METQHSTTNNLPKSIEQLTIFAKALYSMLTDLFKEVPRDNDIDMLFNPQNTSHLRVIVREAKKIAIEFYDYIEDPGNRWVDKDLLENCTPDLNIWNVLSMAFSLFEKILRISEEIVETIIIMEKVKGALENKPFSFETLILEYTKVGDVDKLHRQKRCMLFLLYHSIVSIRVLRILESKDFQSSSQMGQQILITMFSHMKNTGEPQSVLAWVAIAFGFNRIHEVSIQGEDQENRCFKRAKIFLEELFQNTDALKNVLKVYKIFNDEESSVNSDYLTKEFDEEALMFLSRELIRLLPNKIYLLSSNNSLAAQTFPNGEIGVSVDFLTHKSDDIPTARLVMILLHEIAHKKRGQCQGDDKFFLPTKRTPEKYGSEGKIIETEGEAGRCLEILIFGGCIGTSIRHLDEIISTMILNPKTWTNKEDLNAIYSQLSKKEAASNITSGAFGSPIPPVRYFCGTSIGNDLEELKEWQKSRKFRIESDLEASKEWQPTKKVKKM